MRTASGSPGTSAFKAPAARDPVPPRPGHDDEGASRAVFEREAVRLEDLQRDVAGVRAARLSEDAQIRRHRWS